MQTQLRTIVLALAALQAVVVVGYLILLAVGPKSDLAGQGMAYAYGVLMAVVVGVPALIATGLALARRWLWVALVLVVLPLGLLIVMLGVL